MVPDLEGDSEMKLTEHDKENVHRALKVVETAVWTAVVSVASMGAVLVVALWLRGW